MSRKLFHKIGISLILGVLLCECPLAANADWVSSNGDFGSTWSGDGNWWSGISLADTSQSPFTNAYAKNSSGVSVAASAANNTFGQTFADIAADSQATYYLNADFRNNDTNVGRYSISIASGFGAYMPVQMYITGTSVSILSSTGWSDLGIAPVVGTWYNVQLALDLKNYTYSGTITPYGGSSYVISSRGLYGTHQMINQIFSDSYGNTENAPGHDIDNFGLSTTAIPEPGMVILMSTGIIGLLAYAWKKRK